MPWATAWLLYAGGKTTALLGWGGIIFTSIIVFIAPLALALHAVDEYDAQGSVEVYGEFFQEKSKQKIVLMILLFLSVVSITLAIIGEFR